MTVLYETTLLRACNYLTTDCSDQHRSILFSFEHGLHGLTRIFSFLFRTRMTRIVRMFSFHIDESPMDFLTFVRVLLG